MLATLFLHPIKGGCAPACLLAATVSVEAVTPPNGEKRTPPEPQFLGSGRAPRRHASFDHWGRGKLCVPAAEGKSDSPPGCRLARRSFSAGLKGVEPYQRANSTVHHDCYRDVAKHKFLHSVRCHAGKKDSTPRNRHQPSRNSNCGACGMTPHSAASWK